MIGINWKIFVEIASSFAIVGGLVFVGLQMQQAQAISTAELQQEMIASRMSLSELMSDNSELLAKANSGAELSSSEDIALEAPVMSQWGWAFFGQRRWEAVSHPAVNAPVRAFAIFLRDNPGAMKSWRKRQPRMKYARNELGGCNGIQDAFDAQVDAYVSKLTETTP